MTPAAQLTPGERALHDVLIRRGAAFAAEEVKAGLPSRRSEAWKWSDLRSAVSAVPEAGALADIPQHLAKEAAARNDVAAILALGLANRVLRDPARPDGVIRTEAGSVLDIDVKAGEAVTVVEAMTLSGPLTTAFTAARIAAGGRLTRVLVQDGGLEVGVSSAHIRVGEGAAFTQVVLAQGGKLARIETQIDVEGEAAEIDLSGVYMCGAGAHADLTSVVRHAGRNGRTRQLIRGAAAAGGRGVFRGRIAVERSAQGADARQHHNGVLLQPGAEIFAKPELMIYADDVQCAHGNTVGALDERALFYMRSRGVSEREARAILLEGFLADAIPAHLDEKLRASLVDRIGARLRELAA